MGGIVCDECAPVGSPRISATSIEVLRALIAGDWVRVDAASPREAAAASGVIAAYAQWHLERGIRSLSLVEGPR
jgi:DNA repair protein RecO (recombination protein O)